MKPFTPTTTSTSSNVTATWTGRFRQSHHWAGWIGLVDQIGHMLHLPRWAMKPVCDLYDIRAGIPKADLIYMDYTHCGRKAPWWLR